MWKNIYSNSDFQAGAGLDTGGTPGIWNFPVNQASGYNSNCPSGTNTNCLIKLDLGTGTRLQGPIDLTPIAEQDSATPYKDTAGHSDVYQPSSALGVSHSGSLTYLTLAVADKYNTLGLAGRVLTVDVTASTHTTTPYPASLVWASPFFDSIETNPGLALGQFATATYTRPDSTMGTHVFFTAQYFGPWAMGN